MQFIWKPWARKALDQTEAAASKVSQVLYEGAVKAQVKTEITMERVRLQRKAKTLQDTITRQLQMVGSLVYATHRGHPSDSEDIQRLLDYTDQLYRELDLVEQSLRSTEAVPYLSFPPKDREE